MKKSHLSVLITAAFFMGALVIALTSTDSHVVALRILAYLAAGCVLSIILLSSNKNASATVGQTRTSRMDHLLKDAKRFSDEYGDLYVLADKMKQQRKYKQKHLLTSKY